MKRLLPHPLLALALVLAWLVLQQSLAPGNIVIGLLLGWLLSRLWARLEPPPLRVRHVGKLARLGVQVFIDIVASNVNVLGLLLRRQRPTSGFVPIALDIHQPVALAALACIITATPGTVWISHDAGRSLLLIHVLDMRAAEHLVHNIKQRYEPPLREVFQ